MANKYCKLLTAVASIEDSSGLYNEEMSDIITQSKTSNGYSYAVVPGKEGALVTLSDENKNGLDDLNSRSALMWPDPNDPTGTNHAGTHTGGGYGESGHEGGGGA